VRRARDGEAVDVLRVLEGALLDVDVDAVRSAVASGDALVAVRSRTDGSAVVGALVRTWPVEDEDRGTAHVEAVAVRPSWRGRGVGTALVEAGARAPDRLTAAYRPAVRPFYESLGFVVVEGETGGDSDPDAGPDDVVRGVRDCRRE
jgi:GNAT superfamily N-acetyltransferase